MEIDNRANRKIIQITTLTSSRSRNPHNDGEYQYTADILALCDDGTLWTWDGCDWHICEGIPQYRVEE